MTPIFPFNNAFQKYKIHLEESRLMLLLFIRFCLLSPLFCIQAGTNPLELS